MKRKIILFCSFLLSAVLQNATAQCIPPSAISGPSDVCEGSIITLTCSSTPTGGWSHTSGAIIVDVFGGVHGVTAGTAIVTYSNGCFPDSYKTITVHQLPVISGASSVCTGSTVTLSATPSSGTWSSSDPLFATVGASSGVVTGVSAGPVFITYTTTAGCSFAVPMTVIAAATAGTISGTTPICQFATTTFTSSGTAGGSWTSSDITAATVDASTGLVTGTYNTGNVAYLSRTATITYTVSNSCGTSTATRNITVNSSFAAGNTYICDQGGTVTSLRGFPSGGTWSIGTNTTPGLSSIATGGVDMSTGYAAQMGTVTATYSDNCTGTLHPTVVYTSALGCPKTKVMNFIYTPTPNVTAAYTSSCAATITAINGTCSGRPICAIGGYTDLYFGGSATPTHLSSSCAYSYSETVAGAYTVQACRDYTPYGCTVRCGNVTTVNFTPCARPGAPVVNANNNHASGNNLRISPNPTTGELTLDAYLDGADAAEIEIIDVVGTSVLHKNVTVDKGILYGSIQLGADVPTGIYFVKVTSGVQRLTAQFLLNR